MTKCHPYNALGLRSTECHQFTIPTDLPKFQETRLFKNVIANTGMKVTTFYF